MIEKECKNCGIMFGQSLDDGASGDDTANGLCETCQAEVSTPGSVLVVSNE